MFQLFFCFAYVLFSSNGRYITGERRQRC